MEQDFTLYKQQAADYAVGFVKSGMVVGLGHGSTAILAVRRIGKLLDSAVLNNLHCIPCSNEIEQVAKALYIPLTSLQDHPRIDITIDGADEVDPDLNLIKGGGGALLREKIVAQATIREIIVVDESKLSPALGTNWSLPIEVAQFGWHTHLAYLKSLAGKPSLRLQADGAPFVTDQGNYIIDCDFGAISNPADLASKLDRRAGIIEHGLFVNLAKDVIAAGPSGIQHLNPS
ncbi:MAG: ribose-5-phosphate isomerase RpiA [Anaerolineae bacterium]|nr:ribose-5-phosphate isomerase RpiA [Anaerolineae bacterium]